MTKGKRARVIRGDDAGTSERSFKYALIVYAAAEFVAIALALYYKLAR